MKVLLLHGNAKAISRQKLIEEKNKFNPDSITSFGEGVSRQEVLSALSIIPMFSEERVIILENPPEDFCSDLSLVTSHLSLVIWFDHEITKKPILEWVKQNQGQIMFFPESREISIFPFLDLLATGEKKAYLELEKLKQAGFDTQYFITMTFYLLRNLVATPKNAPEFVKQKIMKQRRRFSIDHLMNLYKDVLEIDFKIKTGFLELNQAQFLLVNKFIFN